MAIQNACRPATSKWMIAAALVVYSTSAIVTVEAQSTKLKPQGQADVLIFVDGEKLIGRLERSTETSVTFKSDMAGEVTVDWSKIKELHSSQAFAVIEKDVNLGRHEDPSTVPKGTISVENGQLSIQNGPATRAIPVDRTRHLVDESTFVQATSPEHNIFQDWKTSATFGVAVVKATQESQTYTSAISLSRSFPAVEWMDPRNRTLINFSSSYGKLSQPGITTAKTSIYHAEAERDEYFNGRLYSFAQASFDRNYSQGLDLAQTYGIGIGFTAVKSTANEFDFKAEGDYLNQRFQNPAQNQVLFGSIFSEVYNHKFGHGILFHENLSISPAWSNTRAYSAMGDTNIRIPVFRRVGLTVDASDNFLNDPSPGFRKNSIQFTTGLTYTHQ